MSNGIIVVGGGGHGRVAIDALRSNGIAVMGVVDPLLTATETLLGVPVLGSDAVLETMDPREIMLVNGIGARASTAAREELFERLRLKSFRFVALRHDSAIVGSGCDFGEGSQIHAGVVMQNHTRLGVNAVVNTRASIDHDCDIGPHAFIAPGVILSGNVKVESGAFIGAGAVVLPGVTVGDRSIVGAGAIVRKSVPSGWTVVGNPAVRIGAKDD